jgi:hypothetical protein
MAKEYVVADSIVLRVALDWRAADLSLPRLTSLQNLSAVLAAFPSLPPNSIFLIYGRAHRLVFPHPANPEQGTRWTPRLAGGGTLELVFSRVDEPVQRVYLRYDVYAEQKRCRGSSPITTPRPFPLATTSSP